MMRHFPLMLASASLLLFPSLAMAQVPPAGAVAGFGMAGGGAAGVNEGMAGGGAVGLGTGTGVFIPSPTIGVDAPAVSLSPYDGSRRPIGHRYHRHRHWHPDPYDDDLNVDQNGILLPDN